MLLDRLTSCGSRCRFVCWTGHRAGFRVTKVHYFWISTSLSCQCPEVPSATSAAVAAVSSGRPGSAPLAATARLFLPVLLAYQPCTHIITGIASMSLILKINACCSAACNSFGTIPRHSPSTPFGPLAMLVIAAHWPL